MKTQENLLSVRTRANYTGGLLNWNLVSRDGLNMELPTMEELASYRTHKSYQK